MSFYKEVPGRKTTLESALKFDLAPTAGSTNPVTSGGVLSAQKGAIDTFANKDHNSVIEDITPADEYTVGKFYYINGEFYYCFAKADNVASFNIYSVCEALNMLKGLIDALGE